MNETVLVGLVAATVSGMIWISYFVGFLVGRITK